MSVTVTTVCLWVLTIVVFVWLVTLYATGQQTTSWNYYSNVVWALGYLGAGSTGLVAVRSGNLIGPIRRFILWSSIGMIFYAIAQMIWTYYNVALAVESPSGIADLFYLSIYVFLAAGIFSLLSFYTPILTKRMFLETIVIIAVCFAVLLWLVLPPMLQHPGPVSAFLFNISYPIGDSIISSLFFLLLRLAGGKMHRGILIFSIGLVLLACGDTLFILRDRQGVYWNGDISDTFLATAGLFFWAGMIETIKNFRSSPSRSVAS